MDFNLTEEQEMIRREVRSLADRFDLEYWRDHDKTGEYPHDFVKALLQHGHVEWAGEANGSGNVVSGVVWLQFIQKPQPLLGKGDGKCAVP